MNAEQLKALDTGKALIEAGLHPATGGTGLQACSGDMLLGALVRVRTGHAESSRGRAGH